MSVVECPFCSKVFPLNIIDVHADECLTRQNEIDNDKVACKMCKNDVQLEMIYFLSCDHSFCVSCLKAFVEDKINKKKCSEIKCFEETCKTLFTHHDIQDILQNPDLFKKYNDVSLSEVISSNPNLVECPRCKFTFEKESNINIDYNEVVRGNDGVPISFEAIKDRAENRFRCQSCTLEFCASCHTNPYHLGYTCESYQSFKSSVHCRFCDCQLDDNNRCKSYTPFETMKDVCNESHCESMRNKVCHEVLGCGHYCCGLSGEDDHPPCTHDDCLALIKDDDKTCVICTYHYRHEPTISLLCGHLFHYDCIKTRIENRWTSAMISFDFLLCPLCRQDCDHITLNPLLKPNRELLSVIEKKAMDRLKFMNLEDARELTDPNSSYFKKPLMYAMARFCYYMCHQCKAPYFGGLKDCNAEQRVGNYNPEDLMCGSCSSKGGDECKKHGGEFVEYKCRFCCNVACWFCWGTTHFCDDCHKVAGVIAKKKKEDLPKCTCNVKHPPNGDEFCLGCSVCRFEQNF